MKTFFLIAVLILLQQATTPIVHAGEGHDAGYEWAQQHDITDTGYSNGNSESFNEGVRRYAEEQAENEEE
jgi:hypothetical protein